MQLPSIYIIKLALRIKQNSASYINKKRNLSTYR